MRVPASTYRLQMTQEFGFTAARDALPYLERLGVTDVYLSPILRAAPGSTHGYDVADPTMLDPRLGTPDEFLALSAALRERGMGLALDIVPNHMAAHVANPWWHDVLEHGSDSHYAAHFDIDWAAGAGRVLLPVLGAPLEDVLAAGELSVDGDHLAYYDHRWPLAAGSADAGDLRAIVDAQHYELADWREQARRLNYRRFFDITDLVGVQVERADVFDDVHRFVLELVRDGHVTGLRVDHVDGLRDPKGYLRRLQDEAAEAAGTDTFWVVVEKIVAPHEPLPRGWAVAGTTGYGFLDATDGLFVDPDGAHRLAERYADATGMVQDFDAIVAQAKLRIVRDHFWGELTRLTRRIVGDAAADDDVELRHVRDAIAVVTAALPVYRTYVDDDGPSASDLLVIERALADAAANASVDPTALARVGRALRHDVEFAMRWQQFSGPVTAKSVEDTAFYRYSALPARNEVGAHPSHPAAAVGTFHWLLAGQHVDWPDAMNASSTHDTKRGEDTRARMLVLTQQPDRWADTVVDWLARFEAPDANDGWMVATNLVGAWPVDAGRIAEYVRKAVREEKLLSSWTDPVSAYEDAIIAFAERLRTSGEVERVVADIDDAGRRTSLAAAAIRMFAPGVPDTYQGTEFEAFTLVDPDNRRAVDYGRLDGLLDTVDAPAKLRLVAACLRARREHRDLFRHGDYLPVRTELPGVLAFARRRGDRWALVAVPLPGFQVDAGARLTLPPDAPSRWSQVVDGAVLDVATSPVSELLAQHGVIAALA